MPRPKQNTNGEKVLCPCFRGVGKSEIMCEPHVPECSINIIRYRGLEACRKQIKLYCEGNYKRCEHYLAVKHFKWDD